jgi:hypothetical protein
MLMFAMAVLFLFGSLGTIGWMFRDEVMPLVQRFLPNGAGSPDGIAGGPSSNPGASLPTTADVEPIPEIPQETAQPSEPVPKPRPPALAFDPMESAPQRPASTPPEGIATTISEPPLRQEMTGSVALPPPTPDNGPKELPPGLGLNERQMLEVPAPEVRAGIQPNAAESNVSSQQRGPFTRIENIEPGAVPAAEALEAFLGASDVEERLKRTLGAEAMAPLMERYYSRTPDGPVIVDLVQFVRYDPEPQVGSGAHAVFGLGSQTWEFPLPVMLEETKDGWKVDWLAFVEFKDRLLEKFLDQYQEGPARFHVGLSRTHFFDDTVPNADSKDAFRVGPAPPKPFLHTVFLPKDSSLASQLKSDVSWGAQVWAIVELQWRRLGGDKWVELVAVPQLNWYSVPAVQAGTPPTDSESPQAGEVLRAMPAGR